MQRAYGGSELLELTDVEEPGVTDDSVLVRIRAASVNALDWRRVRGTPLALRLDEGIRRPKEPLLGVDAAGYVEKVGKDVQHLRPGDEVFGVARGSFAEYARGRTFAPKPRNLTFEQAAAVPVAGSTALQALRDKGGLKAGQSVLVNGAGGGVGTFVVQIAKALGADVTAATRTASTRLVRSLGVDHVIDYTRDDFTAGGTRYDLIIDVGGRISLRACRRALSPRGKLVLVGAGTGVGGPVGRYLGALARSRILHQPVVGFVSWESTDDLLALKDLIEGEKVTPVIDTTYPLSETSQAIRHVENGQARGKVVISV